MDLKRYLVSSVLGIFCASVFMFVQGYLGAHDEAADTEAYKNDAVLQAKINHAEYLHEMRVLAIQAKQKKE